MEGFGSQIMEFGLTWYYMGFPGGSAGKESTCSVGDLCSVPGLGRSPGEGNSYPVQFWPGVFHGLQSVGVTKSQTWLSSFHFGTIYELIGREWHRHIFEVIVTMVLTRKTDFYWGLWEVRGVLNLVKVGRVLEKRLWLRKNLFLKEEQTFL